MQKCLLKEADERYQTARDLLVELQSLHKRLAMEAVGSAAPEKFGVPTVGAQLSGVQTETQQTQPTSSAEYLVGEIKRHKLAASVVLALLIPLVVGLFMWEPWRAPQDPEPLRAVSLSTLPGLEHFPSLSPDGNYVVFTWSGAKQDNQDIYVQMIGSGSPLQRTTDPRHAYNPVWSPDGRWVAFFRSQPPAPTGLRSRELWLIP